jgi:hypothetical protein
LACLAVARFLLVSSSSWLVNPAEAGIQFLIFFFARHSSGRWNPVLDLLLFGASAELRLACGEPVTFWQLPKK